ncbi:hypothetical protein BDY21DRAFT_336985 [Lineolata rhizophorae]|uniref:Myb-like domain-containing protein n=1 Tax=Lineolata rhizophorae TaxID=578093 RepID=A0A6A6P863_9PEZI|nr:hypothetical protein BDY21DRAFT_336985 [Lineolata rhizophorae]
MDRPYKRPRLQSPSAPDQDVARDPPFRFASHISQQRLKRSWEAVIDKYAQDFEGVGDEIDLETGEIVVNNGHLSRMQHEGDAVGEAEDGDWEYDEEADNEEWDEEEDNADHEDEHHGEGAWYHSYDAPDGMVPETEEGVGERGLTAARPNQSRQDRRSGLSVHLPDSSRRPDSDAALQALTQGIAAQIAQFLSSYDRTPSRQVDPVWASPPGSRGLPRSDQARMSSRHRQSPNRTPALSHRATIEPHSAPSPNRTSIWAPSKKGRPSAMLAMSRRIPAYAGRADASSGFARQNIGHVKPLRENSGQADGLTPAQGAGPLSNHHLSSRMPFTDSDSSERFQSQRGHTGYSRSAPDTDDLAGRGNPPFTVSCFRLRKSYMDGTEIGGRVRSGQNDMNTSIDASENTVSVHSSGPPTNQGDIAELQGTGDYDPNTFTNASSVRVTNTDLAGGQSFNSSGNPSRVMTTGESTTHGLSGPNNGVITVNPRVRIFTDDHPCRRQTPFTFEDDELLVRLRLDQGLPWDSIVRHWPRFTKKQINRRYYHVMKQRYTKAQFSDEDSALLMLLKEDGKKSWAEVGEFFPGLDLREIKYHYEGLNLHGFKPKTKISWQKLQNLISQNPNQNTGVPNAPNSRPITAGSPIVPDDQSERGNQERMELDGPAETVGTQQSHELLPTQGQTRTDGKSDSLAGNQVLLRGVVDDNGSTHSADASTRRKLPSLTVLLPGADLAVNPPADESRSPIQGVLPQTHTSPNPHADVGNISTIPQSERHSVSPTQVVKSRTNTSRSAPLVINSSPSIPPEDRVSQPSELDEDSSPVMPLRRRRRQRAGLIAAVVEEPRSRITSSEGRSPQSAGSNTYDRDKSPHPVTSTAQCSRLLTELGPNDGNLSASRFCMSSNSEYPSDIQRLMEADVYVPVDERMDFPPTFKDADSHSDYNTATSRASQRNQSGEAAEVPSGKATTEHTGSSKVERPIFDGVIKNTNDNMDDTGRSTTAAIVEPHERSSPSPSTHGKAATDLYSLEELAFNQSTSNAQGEPVAAAQKRGRGRPRKHWPSKHQTVPGRGPGRPRKDQTAPANATQTPQQKTSSGLKTTPLASTVQRSTEERVKQPPILKRTLENRTPAGAKPGGKGESASTTKRGVLFVDIAAPDRNNDTSEDELAL